MESTGESADDHGSGWLLVKKKHRSSSKFSLHGWVGGLSGKQASGVLPSRPASNAKGGSSNISLGGQPSKARENSVVHGSSVANSPNARNEDETDVQYLDKCVVSQRSQCSESSVQSTVSVSKSVCETGHLDEVSRNGNSDTLPKIKWGNLDDGALILNSRNVNGMELRFGGIGIGTDYLVPMKDGITDNTVSCTSACEEIKDNKLVVASIEADEIIQESSSLSPKNEPVNETHEEVKEVSLEDVKVRIASEKMVYPSGDVSCYNEAANAHTKETSDNLLGSSGQSGEYILSAGFGETVITAEINEPSDSHETRHSKTSEVPDVCGDVSIVVVSVDSEIAPHENSRLDDQREFTAMALSDDSGDPQDASMADEFSNMQAMSSNVVGDAGESKERFRQRLWCFLFENLNRAVDELYLLCELECDLEQMKEAMLVLEEAECDFKELKSRVEEFEKVKRSSQLSDGVPKTLKSEHRRPHALSWEVRRMTTSPHRAEILSSSLEAFRRIQQERTIKHGVNDSGKVGLDDPNPHRPSSDILKKHAGGSDVVMDAKEPVVKSRKPSGVSVLAQGSSSREKRNVDSGRSIRINSAQYGRLTVQNQSASSSSVSTATLKDSPAVKSKREVLGSSGEKVVPKKDKLLTEGSLDKNVKCVDNLKRQSLPSERFERDMEKKNDSNGILFRSMDAWKQKRNWEDILAFPLRSSSRFSHSPGMSRKSAERARILRDKLMSPEKKKKTSVDMKKEAEEKHARALRIRSELENERVQKLQRSSEKLNRVNEWQAVRSSRLREGMHARHQRSESRYEAHLAQVVRRAGDESSKVNEVRFITSLNEENRKLMFLQKHQESELRRAEKLKDMKTKQKEDMAREEAVLERKKLIEAEKLQRLAEIQRRKEEAQLRREEERKASSAAREAKAMEQMRRKEFRAKAQQEEAELLAQKLAERLSESEQRRKFYLEQIRERASMDHRDQTSPLPRRLVNKETHGRLTSANSGEDDYVNNTPGIGGAILPGSNLVLQHSLKRRIKKIRQRLMALKYELPELSLSVENTGIGYRAAVGTARAKISRWLQELQRHRLARKEGAASIGLVTAEMIKFMEGKDPELQASRQAGLLDFIASALPASHTTKLEACQVTMYLLRLLRVVLSLPSNRSYFIAQNLLPPIIPMLAAALENFIKIAASTSVPGSTSLTSSKSCMENLDSISEVLDGFLWTVAAIIGHMNSDERQLQMQEGLLELVVSYQVIHRLRDLFALYDRPQVEGSPFPSSILLSINLLVILTSKFRAESSIDWENFPIEVMPVKIEQKTNHVEVANLVASSLYDDLNGNYKVSSSTVSGGVPLLLEDKPEDQSLDQSCYIKNGNESILLHKKECAADESRSSLREDIAKPSISKKDEKNSVDVSAEQMTGQGSRLKQPVACLLSAISETGLVCLPSLLTAVLLQANNRLSYEQASYALPSNFEEVAAGVLKVLNNLALIDITFIQRMLARADLKMELFHIMSFLLSHCTSKWGATTDQIGLLLLECLLLLGYFAMFHPENQAVLRWGKSPTILHKVCDLPFVFFSDPELMPVLAGTLVAACLGCEQNRGVVQQELSTDMLISLLRSCRTGLVSTRSISAHDNPPIDESTELNQLVPESKKLQGDIPRRSDRLKSTRGQPVKGSSSINNTRSVKIRNPKDGKAMKLSEDIVVKHNLSTSGTYSNLMLHSRFTGSFIDKAEQFFSAELPAHVEI